MNYLLSTYDDSIGKIITEDENGNSFLLYTEEKQYSLPTVTIGNQTWASKNIEFYDGQTDIIRWSNYKVNGYNFGLTYWYKRSALERIEEAYPDFRIPTDDDILELQSYMNNNCEALRGLNGWTNNPGTDLFGFDGQPLGYCDYGEYTIISYDKGTACVFFTTTQVAKLKDDNTFEITTPQDTWNQNIYSVRLIAR